MSKTILTVGILVVVVAVAFVSIYAIEQYEIQRELDNRILYEQVVEEKLIEMAYDSALEIYGDGMVNCLSDNMGDPFGRYLIRECIDNNTNEYVDWLNYNGYTKRATEIESVRSVLTPNEQEIHDCIIDALDELNYEKGFYKMGECEEMTEKENNRLANENMVKERDLLFRNALYQEEYANCTNQKCIDEVIDNYVTWLEKNND